MAEPTSNTINLNQAVNLYLKNNPDFDFADLGKRSWFGKRVVIGFNQNLGWRVIEMDWITATIKAAGLKTESSACIVGAQWTLERYPPIVIESENKGWAETQAGHIKKYLDAKVTKHHQKTQIQVEDFDLSVVMEKSAVELTESTINKRE
jgi:hypothetical protein